MKPVSSALWKHFSLKDGKCGCGGDCLGGVCELECVSGVCEWSV